MAIVPKRKTSKQRKHKRNTHSALDAQNLEPAKIVQAWLSNTLLVIVVDFIKAKKLLVTPV